MNALIEIKYQTHNEKPEIDIIGHGRGNVTATYEQLIELFGKPMDKTAGYKIDAEWVLEYENGAIVTVYNWKNGKNYLGPEGLEVEDIDRWSVGGNTADAPDYVKRTIASEVKPTASMPKWELIGECGVDSGALMIGDPCYFMEDGDATLASAKLDEQMSEGHQLNYSMGHAGLGVVARTAYGDGVYPVYAFKYEGSERAQAMLVVTGDGNDLPVEVVNLMDALDKSTK